MTQERRAQLRRIVVVILAVVSVLAARGVFEGRAAMRRAVELDARGDVEGAIAHAMRAAKWYVPLASHPREAYDLLRTIARRAEAAGDVDTALVAWQAVRAAARGTKSFYTPYEERLLEADRQIAHLLASKPPPGIDRDKPREKLVEEHRALLARDESPRAGAVVALYAGIAVWLLGAHRVALALERLGSSAGDDRDALRRRAMIGAALALAGIGVFLLAVARA